MTTATSWISKKPDRCGGDACVRDSRITVWGLVSYRRLGLPDAEILRAIQGLTLADLEAAWEYAAVNPEEIDRVEPLRRAGHDVLTAQEDGRKGDDDPLILARAHSLGRAVLTYNRRHFERLDRVGADHSGILSTTRDSDFLALAARIDARLARMSSGRWCIRVNRPPPGKVRP